MEPGISVLIPVFRYDCRRLVQDLSLQLAHKASLAGFKGEVIVMDDASGPEWQDMLLELSLLPFVKLVLLNENVGRSRIRNLLARQAQYDHVVFLDGDSGLLSTDFLAMYWRNRSIASVLAGGTAYESELPEITQSLRWHYGLAREQVPPLQRQKLAHRSLALNNLFMRREVVLTYPIDEQLDTYGHEDTKLGYVLQQARVPIFHLENPVLHLGLEDNEVFLSKTRQAVENLYLLATEQGLGREALLWQVYSWLGPLRPLVLQLLGRAEEGIVANLLSPKPRMRLMDAYKLLYLLRCRYPFETI
jgi:glycosyltransferase involved in cell wall biosynthesis